MWYDVTLSDLIERPLVVFGASHFSERIIRSAKKPPGHATLWHPLTMWPSPAMGNSSSITEDSGVSPVAPVAPLDYGKLHALPVWTWGNTWGTCKELSENSENCSTKMKMSHHLISTCNRSQLCFKLHTCLHLYTSFLISYSLPFLIFSISLRISSYLIP